MDKHKILAEAKTEEATKNKKAFRRDLAIVKKLWPGQVHGIQRESLKAPCREYQFSVRVGNRPDIYG
jgi:hypothetical protein